LYQSRVSGFFDDLKMDHSDLTDKSENGGMAFLADVKVMNRCMDPVRFAVFIIT
tara:strand:+ start:1714 stop:1875 length:162 start_codon:yes stop_codon:yes gene_type:complete